MARAKRRQIIVTVIIYYRASKTIRKKEMSEHKIKHPSSCNKKLDLSSEL